MNEALETYKDAVWSYLLEHSDITPRGQLFVKFHTDSRQNFENHIKGRWKYDYHRGDPKEKDRERIKQRLDHLFQLREEKLKNKERYIKNLARGVRVQFWRRWLVYVGLDHLL